MIILKIAMLIICALALIVTFRTENILKTFFRVESPSDKTILKTKSITLLITIALFIVAMLIFR